jgi:hypothetical protein
MKPTINNISLIAILTVSLAVCSCSNNTATTKVHPINVSFNGISVCEIALTDIDTLPKTSVVVGTDTKAGPTLLSALQLAGVLKFGDVRVFGYSESATTTTGIDLAKIDVNDTDILFFTNRGTLAIFGPNIPPEFWKMDITDLLAMPGDCCAAE